MALTTRAHEDEKRSSVAKQMSKWVEQVLGTGFHCPGETWSPSVNLYEADTYYCVVADLAGIEPNKVDLRIDRGSLVISGQRPTPGLPPGCQGIHLLMMEIDHGTFCRSIKMPPDIDEEAITASYRSGYLWVRLPKRA